MSITGTAAGLPYVALPPAVPATVPGDGGTRDADDVRGEGGAPGARESRDPPHAGRPAPLVVVWHPLGDPPGPAEMAAAVPLAGVPAWRVYPALPPPGDAADALDRYAPIVERAVELFPRLVAELRARLPVDGGPVGLVGTSAGGHACLLTAAAGTVPVGAAAAINPAVTAGAVMAVTDRYLGTSYSWSARTRERAVPLDALARAGAIEAPLLLVTGELEYPEFQPDHAALHRAVPGSHHLVIPGLEHGLFGQPCAPVDTPVTEWLATRMPQFRPITPAPEPAT